VGDDPFNLEILHRRIANRLVTIAVGVGAAVQLTNAHENQLQVSDQVGDTMGGRDDVTVADDGAGTSVGYAAGGWKRKKRILY
jgi:hypothetical protein